MIDRIRYITGLASAPRTLLLLNHLPGANAPGFTLPRAFAR